MCWVGTEQMVIGESVALFRLSSSRIDLLNVGAIVHYRVKVGRQRRNPCVLTIGLMQK
jgi:hypothetical protein